MNFTRPPRPSTRLNYHALDTALHDLAKSKKRDPHLLQLQNCAQAYRKDDGIVLKLYNTEIITFHVDHTIIDCKGWVNTTCTRQWLREAGHYVYHVKATEWSSSMYLYHQGGWSGASVLYYDGIVIGKDGAVTSERKPMVKRTPNAEAKALLRKWRAVVREHYEAHMRMYESSNVDLGGRYVSDREAFDTLEKGEFNFDMIVTAYANRKSRATSNMHNYVRNIWSTHILRNGMFDEVPYQPRKE